MFWTMLSSALALMVVSFSAGFWFAWKALSK